MHVAIISQQGHYAHNCCAGHHQVTEALCHAEPYCINTHAAHDVHRDIVHVTAVHQQVPLVVHWWKHADNGHAGPYQSPKGALLMHAGLPLAQICGVAEVAAKQIREAT